MRWIRISSIRAAVALAVVLIPTYSNAGTVTETFDSFTCAGAWVQDPSGPNTSYIRDCGNGWTAYAEDTSDSAFSFPGGIGSQNNIALDTTVNGPSALVSTPLASALLNTAPNNTPMGVLWLLKSYPVEAGVPIQTVSADARVKISDSVSVKYGIVVFDGIVTNPSGVTDLITGLPTRSDTLSGKILSSGTTSTTSGYACEGVTAGQWCAWRTLNAGGQYIVPKSSYITVAFRVDDTSTSQTSFGEVDNLTVSGVVTVGNPTVPPNDLGQQWKATYLASGSNNMAQSADIVADAAGNSYVTGSKYNGLNYDIVTIKYGSAGALAWSGTQGDRTYDGGSGDQGVAIALDPTGSNVYVVGRSYSSVSSNNDYVVLKYDAAGNLLWQVNYDNAGKDDVPTGLAVNASGVYVTGSSCTNNSAACDYATVKLDPTTGGQLWAKTYNRAVAGDELDKAISVKLDVVGNVYVTGTGIGASDDILTIKYDSAGTLLWEKAYDSGWDDRASAFAVDSAGNSYIAGMTYAGGSPSIIALKYDSSGNQQWIGNYSGSIGGALASAIAIDSGGNVYVTGKTGRVLDHDIATIKFLSDGTIAWAHTFGTTGLDDWGVDIAVDGGGNTYVLAAMTRSAGNSDFVTVKYDAAGTAISAITYDAFTGMDTPSALALGVDAGLDTVVYATGASADLGSLKEISTVRYVKERPDLTMTAVSGPSSAVVGSSITVYEAVLNIDDITAKKHHDSGAFDVGIYLTPVGLGLPDLNNLTLIGTRHVTNLTPGQSSAASDIVTIPNTVAEGTYSLVVVADSNNAVIEEDETNNAKVAAVTIAITATQPDLVVTALSGPSNITRDVPFNVTTTVSNVNSTAAGSFRVGIYLSADANVTTGDTLIGSRSIAGLAGSSSDTATTSVTVPSATVPAGTYYLGVIADDQAQVTEFNESNNVAVLGGGAGNSTLVSTDLDFVAGLPGTYVSVYGKGYTAYLALKPSAIMWTAKSSWDIPAPAGTTSPAFVDLNGDGLLDLLIGSSNGTTYAYKNTGTATVPIWSAMSSWNIAPPANGSCPGMAGDSSANTYSRPTIGDMNGDGMPDILLIGFNSGICAYENTGTVAQAVWTRNPAWDVPTATTPSLNNTTNAPTLGDLNGDGKLDLMVGQFFSATTFAYKNTGTATSPIWTYTPAWNYVASSVDLQARPSLEDVNHDGILDLMIGNGNGTTKGIKNNGTVNAPAWVRAAGWDVPVIGGDGYSSPAFGDVNGDGLPDIMMGGLSGITKGVRNINPYWTNGIYTSKVIDAGNHGGFTTLSYQTLVPSGTTLSVDIRAGDTSTPDASWTLGGNWYQGITPGGDISVLGTHRYVQYRVNMATTNTALTPRLYSIQANTAPAAASVLPVAVVVGGGGSGGGELGVVELLILSLAAMFGGSRRRRDAH